MIEKQTYPKFSLGILYGKHTIEGKTTNVV